MHIITSRYPRYYTYLPSSTSKPPPNHNQQISRTHPSLWRSSQGHRIRLSPVFPIPPSQTFSTSYSLRDLPVSWRRYSWWTGSRSDLQRSRIRQKRPRAGIETVPRGRGYRVKIPKTVLFPILRFTQEGWFGLHTRSDWSGLPQHMNLLHACSTRGRSWRYCMIRHFVSSLKLLNFPIALTVKFESASVPNIHWFYFWPTLAYFPCSEARRRLLPKDLPYTRLRPSSSPKRW